MIGSLCSGYDGLGLGLGSVVPGLRPGWFAENCPDASRVLKTHHPEVRNLGDLAAIDYARVARPFVLTAGFPCRPISTAGRQLATADPRWLWPEVNRAVLALRPPLVLLENVRNITSIHGGAVLATVLGDLRAAGYAVRWTVVGACAVGACHHRHRWFALGTYVGAGNAGSAERVAATVCGAPRGRQLPTPTARDGDPIRCRGEGGSAYWASRREAGRTNGMPLGAALPEWMMGLPSGYLAGPVPDRAAGLRLAGNGAMPAQVAHAVRILAPHLATAPKYLTS